MTGNIGVLPPQDSQSRPKHRKPSFSAEHTDNILEILNKDTILLDNVCHLYPFQTIQRRRLFQDLVNRFFRQIRSGCQNLDCETPTCLSYQKKRAKGPFRRLTVLSARTLASNLASQDSPEQNLCPYLPLLVKQPDGNSAVGRRAKKSLQIQTKTVTQAPSSPKNAEIRNARTTIPEWYDGGLRSVNTNRNIPHCENGVTLPSGKGELETNENAKVKDPKSFTQNLYDTFSWKALQSLIYQNGSFGWVSPNSATEAVKEDAETMTVAHGTLNPYANVRNYNKPSSNLEEVKAVGIKEDENHLEKTSHATDSNLEKAIGSSNVSDSLMNDLSGTTHRCLDGTTDNDKTFKTGYSVLSDQFPIEDDHSSLKSIKKNLFNSYATLSHFTLENVKALARSTRAPSHSEQCLSLSMGRTEASVKSADRSTGSLFAIQSMVYVLGTTVPLLQSFKQFGDTITQDSDIHVHQSNHRNDIVYAFQQLRQLEGHPQRIFPSLWISLEDAFAWDTRIRPSIPRDRYFPKASGRCFNATIHKAYDTEGKMMRSLDAAHIIKVALSALVASVPRCAPETWEHVVKTRASGRTKPDLESPELSIRFSSLATAWEVMDAYEDELAIYLMSRLIRAFTTRRCWSEILEARNVDDIGKSEIEEKPAEFLQSLLHFLQEEKVEQPSFKNDEPIPRDGRGSTLPINGEDQLLTAQDTTMPSFSMIMLEWLRNVMLKEWDGKPEISRWSVVGGTLDFMACLYKQRIDLGLTPKSFCTPFISERLDSMEMPVEWLTLHSRRETIHLLRYPFLFPPATLVTYFRAINHAAMLKAFESSMMTARMMIQMSHVSSNKERRLFNGLKTALANYFVLDIRRDNILVDALNQLWRREKRELMKPLKVRMGMDEGEEGVDHGGVQQEFFRLAIRQALNPDYRLFTTETQTRMSWFQPWSLEPLYKFELIGLLVSLAVYNGLTLPVTFPMALYYKLLDMQMTDLNQIRDGWPGLFKGFTDLLKWSEGDVEDVFMRSYVFSVDTPTIPIIVDMERVGRTDTWPSACNEDIKKTSIEMPSESSDVQGALINSTKSSVVSPKSSDDGSDSWVAVETSETSLSESYTRTNAQKTIGKLEVPSTLNEASTVNNKNRERYVQDYIFWLTDKSIRPQYEAFARGFFTCIDKKALSVFTPEALQTVVEGIQEIDLDELQKTTKYENGYSVDHRVIEDFWSVVRGFSTDKVRRLLEFVTASDRIPVNGVRSIMFVIQRNGTNDERLPTSLTCFGRLLLPEYSCKEKLEERLSSAIANCQGFGVA